VRNCINLDRSAWVLVALLLAMPAQAQRVLELPMRGGAGADALATGALAVFWNPGSLGVPAGRGEALIMEVRGPSATGLDGFGLAGVTRLDERTALAFGYQRAGLEDIEQTGTSPLPEAGASPLEVAENTFSFGAMRALGALSVGAGVRYTRTSAALGGQNVTAVGAGFRAAASLASLRANFGGAVHFEEEGTDWIAGLGVDRTLAGNDWSVGGEYGLSGSPRYHGTSHRMALAAAWRDLVRTSAGVVGEPGAEGHTWTPVVGIGLRFTRYQLGVLREDLPSELGPVYSFRFGVSF
jgi:hypothetical protein